MSGKRYPEEFKIQAVEQVTKQGHTISSTAERLGISYKFLCDWVKKYDKPEKQRKHEDNQSAELRKLKAELKRVTMERDMLKEATVSSNGRCNSYIKILICIGVNNEAAETNIYTR